MKVLVLTFFMLLGLAQDDQVNSQPTQIQKTEMWSRDVAREVLMNMMNARERERLTRPEASADFQDTQDTRYILQNGILGTLK